MMSISSYSWNGQILKDPPNLELTELVEEYNSKMVLISMSNIIGANAVFLFQSNRLIDLEEIITLQNLQITNYTTALHSCESEILIYKEVVVGYEELIDLKGNIIKQEKRRTWVYRTLVGALTTYIIVNSL